MSDKNIKRRRVPNVTKRTRRTKGDLKDNYPGLPIVKSNGPQEEKQKITMSDVSGLFKELGNRSTDSRSIVKLFPDIKIGMNLLSSLVRKPNGETDTLLTVTMSDTKLPTAVRQDVCSVLSTYVNSTYNIANKLKEIVDNTLFYAGSHVELILPDVAIQEFMMEHTTRGTKIGLEDLSSSLSLAAKDRELAPLTSITSGGKSIILANASMDLIDDLPLVGSEARRKPKTDKEIRADIIKYSIREPGAKNSETVELKSIHNYMETNQTGKPLTLTVPSNVILPICSKSDPTNHVGYIALVDENGMFVNPERVTTVQDSEIIKLEKLFSGEKLDHTSTDKMYQLYGDKLESELKNYLTTTKLSTFTNNNNLNIIKEISFQRALKGSKTKLVVLDRSQVIYYAAEYNKDGTGKGRLEDLGTLTSLRAMLLYSNVNGSVKNNIGTMKADITLDPNDPQPMASLDETLKALLSSKMDDMPINTLSSKGLTDWIHKAGIQVSVKHPDLPDINIELEERGGQKFVPDTELGNEIKDYITRGLGLPPELVDSAKDVDFALRLKGLDSILIEEVRELQKMFNLHISKHYKAIVKNDVHAKDLIKGIIVRDINKVKKNLPKETRQEIAKLKIDNQELAEIMLEEVIPDLYVHLPIPSISEPDSTQEEFEMYETKVDDAIKYFFSEDALPEELSALRTEDIELLMEMVKGSLMRKWMLDRSYIPDLNKMLNVDKYGDAELDILGDNIVFMERLDKSFKPYMKELAKLKEKIANSANEEEPNEDDNTGGTPTDGNVDDPSPTGDDDTTPTDGDGTGAGDDDVNNELYGDDEEPTPTEEDGPSTGDDDLDGELY